MTVFVRLRTLACVRYLSYQSPVVATKTLALKVFGNFGHGCLESDVRGLG